VRAEFNSNGRDGPSAMVDWTYPIVDGSDTLAGPMSELQSVIQNFAAQLTTLIEGQAMARARAAVLAAFGAGESSAPRRGRPPKGKPVAVAAAKAPVKKARKKLPKQLCPVPGCKNPAAPVYGMVCSKHRGVAKSKIRKYREARRAKKLGLPIKRAKRSVKRAGAPKGVAVAQPAVAPAAA
jgi:hypothetical protein